jgi:transcriptional regulator with XRE-family HTH domain
MSATQEAGVSRIGEKIKHTRLRANMTSKDLAGATLLSEQYVSDLQRGRRLPSLETLLVICNVFPDADSAEWAWLLLEDLWGPAVVALMKKRALVNIDIART